eukprot:TRINITY_DN79016_c0_g1_i1.p1 TRINITY_DN79016_c0_g1~~TRINITY_DN79016_c0_g1_i1.p1  ORF type:complete len:840 (+),score=193.39 TRINITY_DN79016_c0_g1_i1:89-2608(+)
MDKYERLRELGRGSYGCAVLVRERQTRKQRVVKEIDLSRMPASAQREAKNEVDVLKSLSHPNIVAYCDSFMEGRSLCIVMEYADGGDLTALVKKRKEMKSMFPEAEAVLMFSQCCLAIQHVHRKHILHRDLKCQNIFLTSAGDVKLGDFGIAKVLDSTAAEAITMIGTPIYLAPEVCHSKPYGVKADVWSLGVVLYELLALEPPFSGANIAALINNIVTASPKPLSSSYSEDLRDLALQMLQKQPEKRPTLDQILNKPCIRREAQTLVGWTMCEANRDIGDNQTFVPGGAVRGTPAKGSHDVAAAKGAHDALEELVRQREDPRRRPPVAPDSRVDVVSEFRRNREAALAAKARAEGRDHSAQRRHHSADAVPSSPGGHVGSSRKASEAEHLQALQEAAAQARRDRRQVQQRLQDLEQADAAQRAAPSQPSDPLPTRATSADRAKHLLDLQEAAAQARRDRKQIQQKVKELERGGETRNSEAHGEDATCLRPHLDRVVSDPTPGAYSPARERRARQEAEAEHLQALREARLQAREDRRLIERLRKEQEGDAEQDNSSRPGSAPGDLHRQSSESPRMSAEDKKASEAQYLQALSEAAAQARRDRKLLQQKVMQQQEHYEAEAAMPQSSSAVERGRSAASSEAKQLEEAHRLQALQEAAAQARRDRKLLQQRMQDLEHDGERVRKESSLSVPSPVQSERRPGSESPSLDKTKSLGCRPRSGSLGRRSPTLGLAGSLTFSQSRPASIEPEKDQIGSEGYGTAVQIPEDSAASLDGIGAPAVAEKKLAAEPVAESVPQIVIGLATPRPSSSHAPSDGDSATLGSLSYSATVNMTGSSFNGTTAS